MCANARRLAEREISRKNARKYNAGEYQKKIPNLVLVRSNTAPRVRYLAYFMHVERVLYDRRAFSKCVFSRLIRPWQRTCEIDANVSSLMGPPNSAFAVGWHISTTPGRDVNIERKFEASHLGAN